MFEPQRIGEILPKVMLDIRTRMGRQMPSKDITGIRTADSPRGAGPRAGSRGQGGQQDHQLEKRFGSSLGSKALRVKAWPKAAAKIFLKSDFLQKVFARVWKLAFWSGEEVFGLSVEAIFGNR